MNKILLFVVTFIIVGLLVVPSGMATTAFSDQPNLNGVGFIRTYYYMDGRPYREGLILPSGFADGRWYVWDTEGRMSEEFWLNGVWWGWSPPRVNDTTIEMVVDGITNHIGVAPFWSF